MAILPAKCPNCGAPLKLDNAGSKASICPYCNTAFVVEDAINYHINATTNIQNLHTDNLVIQNNEAKDLLDAGNTFLKLGRYSDAYGKFYNMTEKYPGQWEGWWGRLRTEIGQVLFARSVDPDWIKVHSDNALKNTEYYYSQISTLLDGNIPSGIAEEYTKIHGLLKNTVDHIGAVNTAYYQDIKKNEQACKHEQEQNDRPWKEFEKKHEDFMKSNTSATVMAGDYPKTKYYWILTIVSVLLIGKEIFKPSSQSLERFILPAVLICATALVLFILYKMECSSILRKNKMIVNESRKHLDKDNKIRTNHDNIKKDLDTKRADELRRTIENFRQELYKIISH